MPNETFVQTILDCDSLTDEDTLETKYNSTVYINNINIFIDDSDDLDRPHKLVKDIYDENLLQRWTWKMKMLAQSAQVQMILLGMHHSHLENFMNFMMILPLQLNRTQGLFSQK